MQIIGHRGAKGLAEENSLESIRRAIKNKVDVVEVDVRLQGSVLVLSHDATNKSQVYCPLSQALQEIAGQVPIILDVKETRVVKKLEKVLEKYDGEILISSFKFGTLQETRKRLPDIDIAVIEKWSGLRAVAEASLLSTKRIHINHQWLWTNFAGSVAFEKFKVDAYTVNDNKRADELRTMGVDGIFTDYPNRFI